MIQVLLLACTSFLFVTPITVAETTKLSSLSAGQVLSPQEQEQASRESLKIQQQLGGTLDQKYHLLQPIPNRQHHPKSRPSPVGLLRETASGLDRAANRLEESNLYPQADALRELAQKLRLEARKRQTSQSATVKTPK